MSESRRMEAEEILNQTAEYPNDQEAIVYNATVIAK